MSQQDEGVPLDLVLIKMKGKLGEALTTISVLEVGIDIEREGRLIAEQRAQMLQAKLDEMAGRLENGG